MLRRLVTIPVVGLFAIGLTALAPGLLLLGLGVDCVRGRWSLPSPRIILFGLCFGWIESAGIVALLGVGLFTLGRKAARVSITFAVQRLYTAALFKSVCACLSLRFEVQGDGLIDAGPLLVLVQHASIIDTLVPGVFLAGRHRLKLRYVLKRQLRWGPCLDIAGGWLPNHFVSRDGADSEREISAVRALKEGMGPGEGVLLYPEGTRFSEAKKARALLKLEPKLKERAARLQHLLPPRLGGTLALFSAPPACDLLIIAHHGLEGFASVKDIWSGRLVGTTLRIAFFRIPAAQIPLQREAQVDFLYQAWERVDSWLSEVSRA